MRSLTAFAAMLFGIASVCDAQDSLNIEHIGHLYDTWDIAYDVEIRGTLAFVAAGQAGLFAVNIADSTAPIEIGHLRLPNATKVFVSEDLAYVADESGFRIADISDPTAMSLVSTFAAPHGCIDLAVFAGHAYVLDETGFQVVDVSQPSAPVIVGSFASPEGLGEETIAAYDTYVYLTGLALDWHFASGIWKVDVSDPTAPVTASCNIVPVGVLAVNDSFVMGQHAGQIFYVMSESDLEEIGHCTLATGDGLRDLVARDSLVYAVSPWNLYTIRISNPAQPVILSTQSLPNGFGIAVSTNVACVVGRDGLETFDISNPLDPVLLGSLNARHNIFDVAVLGNYAYVSPADSFVRIVDVSNPNAPVEVASWEAWGTIIRTAIVNGYLYAMNTSQYLAVLNISNPLQPYEVSGYDNPGDQWNIALNGNYLYIATRSAGLQIVDVSNPALPTNAGSYNWPREELSVAASGNYAYVTDGEGMRVVDVTVPSAPVQVGYYEDNFYDAKTVAAAGNYAYLSTDWVFPDYSHHPGMCVVDVSNPVEPSYVTGFTPHGIASRMIIRGNYLIAVAPDYGFTLYDISNPAAPFFAGYYQTTGNARGVDLSGGYAFVADEFSLDIYDCSAATSAEQPIVSSPREFALHQNYPNPFNSATQLTFDLPSSGHAQLVVVNILGRTVATLVDGQFASGVHHVDFEAGNLSSGVYVATLRSGTSASSRKLILLR